MKGGGGVSHEKAFVPDAVCFELSHQFTTFCVYVLSLSVASHFLFNYVCVNLHSPYST